VVAFFRCCALDDPLDCCWVEVDCWALAGRAAASEAANNVNAI
jgi:hypothetical protein